MPEKGRPTRPLAFRIYPEPDGMYYTEEDLSDERTVIELFDYCQILEASIYKEGWGFLNEQYGLEKLYELNKISGWFDSENIEKYKTAIESYILSLKE